MVDVNEKVEESTEPFLELEVTKSNSRNAKKSLIMFIMRKEFWYTKLTVIMKII